MIRLRSRRHFSLEKCGVKGLAQGPNNCADLIMATPEIEPTTLRVQVEYLKLQSSYRLPIYIGKICQDDTKSRNAYFHCGPYKIKINKKGRVINIYHNIKD